MSDWHLWQNEVIGVKKINSKKAAAQKAKKSVEVKPKEIEKVTVKTFKKQHKLSDHSDVDMSSVQKMDKGEYTIDAELDLHGFTIDKAHQSFDSFIESSYVLQRRMVLVITGKGTKSKPDSLKLKDELPKWINRDSIRSKVLRFTYAIRKHGGDGAYYILLRRIRDK